MAFGMTSELQVREVIEDARAYLESRAWSGVVALLDEEFDALRGHDWALRNAVDIADACFYQLWLDKSPAEAAAALELIFRLARGRLFDDRNVDPAIFERYARALVLTGTSPIPFSRYARHQNLLRLFALTEGVAGDVVECGCARGLSAMELCLAIARGRPDWRGEGFHVFDSFEGLSEPQAEDLDVGGMNAAEAQRIQGMMHRGNMAFPLAQLREVFLPAYPDVTFHPGWIPASFEGLPERRYRFVHVDVDLYQPTLDAFGYFFPRLEPGGVVVTDDYNWPGGRKAVDDFCAANGLQAGFTGTSQAFLRRVA
jgi:O-methyltransferase